MPKIKLSQLFPDSRNANVCPAETLEKLANNIQALGSYLPLAVRPHPQKADAYVIVDGHHRKLVLEKLGHTEADCVILDINDAQAQLALASLNRLRGTDDHRKRAELVASLTQAFTVEELAALIPESGAEIEDMLALLRFEDEKLEQAIQEQIQAEKDSLPVPYTFMVSSQEVSMIEQALNLHQEESQDRSHAFVTLCKRYLELNHAQDENQ